MQFTNSSCTTASSAGSATRPFNPYGFLLTGGRSGSGSRGTPASGGGSPGGYSNATGRGLGTPSTVVAEADASPSELAPFILNDTEHGRALGEMLEFFATPNMRTTEIELPASSRCLFMGHLRFETTTADVRWMVKKLTGVNPLRCDIRGNGCCVVYLSSDADVTAVRALNRRVLFDHHGFWFARTADAVDILMDYVEEAIPRLNHMSTGKRRALRLPRDALVVEDSRSSKNHRRSAGKPQQQQASQQQAQPQQPLQPLQPVQPGPFQTHLHQQQQQQMPRVHVQTSSAQPFQHHEQPQPQQPQHLQSFNFHECPPDYALPDDDGSRVGPMVAPMAALQHPRQMARPMARLGGRTAGYAY